MQTGQKLSAFFERRDNGISIHLDIKESTILERDIALVECILKENRDITMDNKIALLRHFNPHGKNKKIMEQRLRVAYKNIVRRDSE